MKTLKTNANKLQEDFNIPTPLNVLNIVRLGVAQSNRGQIFKEIPLQTMDDTIFWANWMKKRTSVCFENLVMFMQTKNSCYFYHREDNQLPSIFMFPKNKINTIFPDKKEVYTIDRRYNLSYNEKAIKFIKENYPEIFYI